MRLHDRNRYRDEARNKESVGYRKNRNIVSRYGTRLAAVMLLILAYYSSQSFQFEMDAFWTDLKTKYFSDMFESDNGPAVPVYKPDQSTPPTPPPMPTKPEVTPWPRQSPWYYRQPNNDPPFDEEKIRNYMAEDTQQLAALEDGMDVVEC
jgi:hypothetical protein